MENLSHSVSKKVYDGNGFGAKTVYDDVFGGPPKFGVPTLSPRVEDYTEIFGSFHASRASSIPILDLPAVDEPDFSFDVQSSLFDYSEVFGGFKGLDFAVSFEELFNQSKTTYDSSDEAWTPAQSETLSDESDPSASSERNQSLSNGESYQPCDGIKQFNISYNKTSQRSNEDMSKGLPLVSELPPSQKTEDRNTPLHITQDLDANVNFSGGLKEGKRFRKTMSLPSSSSFGIQTLGTDLKPVGCGKTACMNEAFFTVSDISLRTQPSQLPPPSRPPPALAVKDGDSDRQKSNFKASRSFAFGEMPGGSSPPYFDVEVDASSSAAISAAAMKDAMEKAQAKLKSAKVLMERKKEGLQSRTKLDLNNDKKHEDRKASKTFDGSNCLKDESVHGTCQRDFSGMKTFAGEERQKAMKMTQIVSDSIEGDKRINVTKKPADNNHGEEYRSSQESYKTEGTVAWREAAQFYEVVETDKSRKIFEQTKDERVVMKNTQFHERGQEQKATPAFPQQEVDSRKIEADREAHEWDANKGRLKATKESSRQEEDEKKVPVNQEVCEQENGKKPRMAQQHGDIKKILTEDDKSEESGNLAEVQQKQNKVGVERKLKEASERIEDDKRHQDAHEREENGRRLKETLQKPRMAQQHLGIEKILTEDDKSEESENLAEVQLKENEVEVEKKLKEATERIEDDKRHKDAHEREENGRRLKETLERERSEKRLKETIEQAEIEKRLKEALDREEKEKQQREACEKEEKEKRQKEARKGEENEYRLKENEKRLREACEREENEKRLEEVCEREENEKRLKEALEQEENEKRLKEALEWEEAEKRPKMALELEENKKKQKLACERDENDKKLVEDLRQEEVEKHLRGALQQEENAKEEKEAHEGEENKDRLNEGDMEGNEKRLEEVWEQEENNKRLREAHEREESEKISKEAFKSKEIKKIAEEAVECEVTQKRFEGASYGIELKGQGKVHEPNGRDENERKLKSDQATCVHIEWENFKASDGSCKLDDYESVQSGQAAHKQDKNSVKVKKTEGALSFEEDRTMNAEPIDIEWQVEVVEVVNVRFEEQFTGMAQDGPQYEKNRIRMNDATESLHLHDTVTESVEAGIGIGQTHMDRNKKACKIASNAGKPNVLTCELGERGTNVKGVHVKSDKEESKDQFMSSTVVSELTENARKMGADQLTVLEGKRNAQSTAQKISASQNTERKEKNFNNSLAPEHIEREERIKSERELEKDHLRKMEEEREREREREKDRMAVDRASLETSERAFAEARERAERAAVERATAKVRQRAMAEARERPEKASAEARERSLLEKASMDALRLRAERAAVERATAEARERAFQKAMPEKATFESRECVERSVADKSSASYKNGGMRVMRQSSFSDLQDVHCQGIGSSSGPIYSYSSVHGGVEGESAQRCKARLERHQRTAERAAKALAEKNMRDLLAQREQTERNRLAEALDAEVKRWSNGKEGNLRALLSTLQYILGSDSGWQPIPLTEVITSAAVKKAYRKATLCVHPDKLQQRGASIQQKYICEKVFDLLKEAWNKFNSEER